MKNGLITAAVCAMLTLASCTKERITGSGSVITETRNLAGFTAITAAGSANVHITQGASFKVEIKGYGNLLPYYETRLVNNTLQLGYKQNTNINNDNIEVYITMPALTGLSTEGSGNIQTTGVFNSNTNLDVSVKGSGNIRLSSGTAASFKSVISGSGNIYGLDMQVVNADTEINGSGNTEISASAQLKVKISGSGNVYYRGTPAISTNISGSGAVLPR